MTELRRILLALDASFSAEATLTRVAELAAAADAELLALFIEDIDLLRCAGLPFTRELGIVSGLRRALEADDMERILRAQALQVEQALARAARLRELRWSFSVARGRFPGEALALAAEMDWVVLARGRRMSLTPRLGRSPSPVAVVFDPSRAGERALAAAIRLVRSSARELTVITQAPALGRLEDELARFEVLGEPAGQRVKVVETKLGAPEIAALLLRTGAEALVLAAPLPGLTWEETAHALLEAAECLLVLVKGEG